MTCISVLSPGRDICNIIHTHLYNIYTLYMRINICIPPPHGKILKNTPPNTKMSDSRGLSRRRLHLPYPAVFRWFDRLRCSSGGEPSECVFSGGERWDREYASGRRNGPAGSYDNDVIITCHGAPNVCIQCAGKRNSFFARPSGESRTFSLNFSRAVFFPST